MKNNNKTIRTQLLLAVVSILMASNAFGAPIMVANSSVPVDQLAQGEVQKVFLGKTANWSDGSRILLSMLKGGDISGSFLKANVKKSPKQFSTFWKKAVFSGTGEMPSVFKTEADLVKFVAANPGSVGYIDEGTPHEGLKVITIK